METLVRYELADGIGTITMDNGKANVMSVRMMQELNAALDCAGRPGRCRAERA